MTSFADDVGLVVVVAAPGVSVEAADDLSLRDTRRSMRSNLHRSCMINLIGNDEVILNGFINFSNTT